MPTSLPSSYELRWLKDYLFKLRAESETPEKYDRACQLAYSIWYRSLTSTERHVIGK